jgi:dihydroflavonol-4-reductase
MSGCRYLMHVAALYSFSPHRREELLDTNVFGCAGLLETAPLTGVERAVVTSSSATVGPAREGRPAIEADRARNEDDSGYHRTKVLEERVALASQLPVILLLPTAPVGPGRSPTRSPLPSHTSTSFAAERSMERCRWCRWRACTWPDT